MDSYLAHDSTGNLTAQITRLLRDEGTDNAMLLLELISGGGANPRLKGYLFGIATNHNAPEVSRKAMQLMERFCSQETCKQAERLRESRGYYFNEAEYIGKFEPGEIDIFDFILAFRMCTWHRSTEVRPAYRQSLLQDLDLSQYKGNQLTAAITTLDFVRSLDLPAHRNFDVASSIPLLKQLPIEALRIEDVKLELFPVEVFDLPNLKKFSIKRRNIRPRHPMQIPEGGPFGAPLLESLTIDSYPFTGSPNLGPFPNLKEVVLNRCLLDDVGFLGASQQLSFIDLRYNQLSEVPHFMSKLTDLQEITMIGNPFRRIEFYPERLPKLQRYHIEGR